MDVSPESSDAPVRSSAVEATPLSVEVARAHAGDHALVHQLLLAVNQGPSLEEFHASLDDPFYEPTDRLLIRRDGRIVSHVHVTKRQIHFGLTQLPAAEVQHLATLPEYRSAGYARRLLDEADQQMRDDGAVVAWLQTKSPELFAQLGWIDCGRPHFLRIRPQPWLAHLSEQHALAPAPPLVTRLWRQVELRALSQLHAQRVAVSYGPVDRDENYWRWLVNRHAYEQILVAIEGEDTLDFGELAPKIVGYAVQRGEQIVELATQPHHAAAAPQLLARVCREAIERDHSSLWVHAAPQDPLAAWLLSAGGETSPGPGRSSEVAMLKVLDRDELLRRLYPEFHARSRGLPRPVQLRMLLDNRLMRFELTRRSVKWAPCGGRTFDLRATSAQFDQMLVGQFDLDAALAAGQLKVRNQAVARQLRALFPQVPLQRLPFDALQA